MKISVIFPPKLEKISDIFYPKSEKVSDNFLAKSEKILFKFSKSRRGYPPIPPPVTPPRDSTTKLQNLDTFDLLNSLSFIVAKKSDNDLSRSFPNK